MSSSRTDYSVPAYVADVLSALEARGHEAYAVGGCVRDTLLGRDPLDWDVTTSASPEETEACFAGMRVIETGLRHGTVTVLSGGKPVEVTTFRTDGDYSDHRHPDEVKFSRRLADDLARRDFTINAMCFSRDGALTDLYGGLGDLRAKLVRCVGEPERRFEEDALRILRGVRFAAVLGFAVESKTADAMLAKRGLLRYVSAERIFAELKKTLAGLKDPDILIRFRPVAEAALPELTRAADDEYARACALAAEAGSTETALACFLSPLAPEDVKSALDRLRCDKKTARYVTFLCDNKNAGLTEPGEILEMLGESDEYFMKGLYEFRRLLGTGGEEAFREAFRRRELGAPVSVRELALSGSDIAALGFSGRLVGDTARALLRAVLYEGLENSKDSLTDYIRLNFSDRLPRGPHSPG